MRKKNKTFNTRNPILKKDEYFHAEHDFFG